MLKPIKENSVSVRRKFDPTFKREAVQNWLASGKSAEVVAKELGLLPNRLYAWRKRFRPPSQELLERLLKQENSLKGERKPSKSPDEKRRRRRRPR